MKMIKLGRSSLDIEHEGESFRLGGELSGEFWAWRSWTARLISKDQTAPLTEEEKDLVMHMVEKYWQDDHLRICFIDDKRKLLCATRAVILNVGKKSIDFMYKRKTVRAWGNRRFHSYRLKADTIEWITPDSVHRLSDDERTVFIEEVMKYYYKSTYYEKTIKIAFVDERGKRIKTAERFNKYKD